MTPGDERKHTLRRTGSKILEWNNRYAKEYARRRYGPFLGRCLAWFTEATIERLARLESNVLHGTDEDLTAFKQTLAGELTMVAVAGAIIAQVAISTFSLPYIADVHYMVRGLFACGLFMGLLSVHSAVMQQRTMGKLHNASQIRTWLLSKSSATLITESDVLRHKSDTASFTAAFLTQLPYTLIEYGIIFILGGFTLYLGFAWKRTLDTEHSTNGNRNVFIMFIICAGLLGLQWAWGFYSKSVWLEQKIMAGDTEGGLQVPAVVPNAIHVQAMVPNPMAQPLAHAPDPPNAKRYSALTEALQRAAESHRRCAEANLLVAKQYDLVLAEKEVFHEVSIK